MRLFPILLAPLGLCLLLASFPGCAEMPDPWKDHPQKLKILASFPPLYSLVKSVGGDRVAVQCLCTTAGPHDYTFNANDSVLIRKADFFFSNGLTLDNLFVDRMNKDAKNPALKLVRLGARLPKSMRIETKDDAHHGPGHEHHNHGSFDPHVWLGIPQVIHMIGSIQDELSLADPEEAGQYQSRAQALIQRIRELETEGKASLEKKVNKKIVTFHESLSYFAKSFGLEIAAVIQTQPGDEPNSPALAAIIRVCLEKKPALIAVEPQYQKTTSAKLLQEELRKKGLNIPLVVIDPLETCQAANLSADWFEKSFKANLVNLVKHLP